MAQPQSNQKNDQPVKPVVVDNKTERPKPADTSAAKPSDTAKTGNT